VRNAGGPNPAPEAACSPTGGAGGPRGCGRARAEPELRAPHPPRDRDGCKRVTVVDRPRLTAAPCGQHGRPPRPEPAAGRTHRSRPPARHARITARPSTSRDMESPWAARSSSRLPGAAGARSGRQAADEPAAQRGDEFGVAGRSLRYGLLRAAADGWRIAAHAEMTKTDGGNNG
jgi:hypothetical protein